LLPQPDDDPTNVRITDFECAKIVTFPNSLHTQCGTQEYVAPEVLENRPAYDVSCDMWTVGVIVFIMVGGYYPFRGKDDFDVLRKVRYGEFKFHSKFWKDISDEAKTLVKDMMTVIPEDRITASQALSSAWFSSDSIHLSANLGENMRDLMDQFKDMSSSRRFQQETNLAMAMSKLDIDGRID
jgi:serine/threonine protein kinase